MATAYQLKIVACDGIFYDGPCESIVFPTPHGQMAVMNHHEPMTAVIDIGEIKFRTPDQEWHKAIISDGLLRVYPTGAVTLLVYSCEKPENIDTFRAKAALERAQEQLRQKQSIQEYHISTANLARAMARLKGADKGMDYNK